MSDTKALIKYVHDRLNDGPNITFGKPTVYDLVEALEQAEAENARLQQRVNELISEELTDGAVRERIQLRLNIHEVLQQNERLTKMVDWLAEQCADGANECPYLSYCQDLIVPEHPAYCTCTDSAEGGFDCSENPKECWLKEAAHRAVAAGEETCQK